MPDQNTTSNDQPLVNPASTTDSPVTSPPGDQVVAPPPVGDQPGDDKPVAPPVDSPTTPIQPVADQPPKPTGTDKPVEPLPPVPPPSADSGKKDEAEEPDIPPVVTTTHDEGGNPLKKLGKTKILTALAVFLLVGGLSAGVLLVQNRQDIREKAVDQEDDCSAGCEDPIDGTCLSGLTDTDCGINGEPCADCSALGQTCSSGICSSVQLGDPVPDVLAPECLDVKAYTVDESEGGSVDLSESWTLLTINGLSDLEEGDVVYFTVTGKAPDPIEFTQAKFKVNDTLSGPITKKKPKATTDSANEIEFYYRYVIPADTYNFRVDAAIYHNDLGWIDSVD